MQGDYENLFNGGDFDQLIDRYEEMLKNGNTYYFDVEDFEQILDYYIDVNHLGKALRAVKYAFKLHPYAVSLKIKKAQILLKDKNPNRALTTLNSIEKLEANNNELFITKGHANVMMGNTAQAKKEYSKALDLITDKDEAVDLMQNIAHTFQLVNNFELALSYLINALKLDNDNIFILQDLAYCYEKMDDLASSIVYYKKYLELDPFSENIWYSLGKVHQATGELENAIKAFEFALAINPRSVDSIYEIALLYEENLQFEKAIDYYLQFLNYEDESSEILSSIANCYNYLDNFKDALNYYHKALEIDSFNPGLHHGIATVLFKKKNYWDALFYAKRSTIIDDSNYNYFVLYGRIASNLHLKSEAITAFEKAVEIKPELFYNWILLVDEFINHFYYRKAINVLEEALEYHEKSALLYFRLAALNYLEKQTLYAVKYFKLAMKIDPKHKKEFFRICPQAKKSKEITKLIQDITYKDQS